MSDSEPIDFLINSMEGGGAERAMANLLSLIATDMGERPTRLILLDDEPHAQTLPDGLRVHTLDGRRSARRSAIELNRFWSANGAPRVCLSYLARANCLNVALSTRFGHRTVISERIHTTSHLKDTRAGALNALLTRLLYPRADRIVAVSQGVADDLATNFAVPRGKLTVIGNPIDDDALQLRASEPLPSGLPQRYILGVGRLVDKKNFALLIEAHAALGPSAPDLVLLGEGDRRRALEDRAAQLGTAGRVQFRGFVPNPYPYMAGALVLVAPSRAEGFPNTLIEAMTLGCPVVATDCPTGPRDVIATEPQTTPDFQAPTGGILVPMEDANAMAGALRAVLDHPEPPSLRDAARRNARRFGKEEVLSSYLDILGSGQTGAERRQPT